MSELLKINVNEYTEKKNGLTYLSWAWAWAKVLEIDPMATWDAHEFDGYPASFGPDGSALVKTSVTIKGNTKSCWLPVMDHRNKAIKNPDSFAVNTAIVRCLTKCISMHGLGLYIYAGEDLPDGQDNGKHEFCLSEWIKKANDSKTLDDLAEVWSTAAAAAAYAKDREGYKELKKVVVARKAELKPDQATGEVTDAEVQE